MRLLLAVTTVIAILPSLSLAVSPASRQSLAPTLAPLHVQYIDDRGALYYNHDGWICKSSLVAVSGNAFPLVLEAVEGKYFHRKSGNTAEADGVPALYTVAVVALPQLVVWNVPEGSKEKEIVLRVRDVDGAVAYSDKRSVSRASYGVC